MVENEEQKEEKLTVKSLKKELDSFKEEVFKRLPPQPLAPVHAVNNRTNPKDVAVPVEPAKKSITFHFHDRFTEPRVFSEGVHGKNWRELANDFQQVNEVQIKKREDK